jgi:hypothetical protein
MLEWNELTWQQKAACALLVAISALSITAMLMSAPLRPSNVLAAAAMCALFAAILLNPSLVRGEVAAALSVSMPRACKVLGLTALALLVLSRAVGAMF